MAKFTKVTTESETAWSEWISPVMKQYRLGCCDCGLVHDVDFKIVRVTRQYADGSYDADDVEDKKVKVVFRARRNKRSTAQLRRHRKLAAEKK